jgi:hypothetical protein
LESLFGPLAHARRGDPDTSREAALEVTPRIRLLQQEVLKFAAQVGARGFTDPAMNDYFDCRSSTYRTRRSELVALGLVEDSGVRVGEGKGRKHAVWRITAAGQDRVDELLNLPRAA